jgi:hypothetical protein
VCESSKCPTIRSTRPTSAALRSAVRPIGKRYDKSDSDTEPYQRLKRRETGLQRSFTDEAFQQFVRSDDLARRADALRQALDQWRSRDLQASARRVLAYLPPNARIGAAVYPVITPQTNSFVADLRADAAIFLYLDPGQSAAKFENTVAHELHHVGTVALPRSWSRSCRPCPSKIRPAVEWMGALARANSSRGERIECPRRRTAGAVDVLEGLDGAKFRVALSP